MHSKFHITSDLVKYKEEVITILYKKYEENVKKFPYMEFMCKNDFQTFIDQRLTNTKVIIGIEKGWIVGVLLYDIYDVDGKKYVKIPVYGYGSKTKDEDRIIGKLFQHLAQSEVVEGITFFSVHVYAHDNSVRELFSLMQFGTMAETCIRKVSVNHERQTKYHIKNLSTREITENWKYVWALTQNIIEHLKESPIFYKGEEFTEELYRSFYLNRGTNVYVAYDDSDEMIGIIESNDEGNPFICSKVKSVNVGEVYVSPKYRGTGLAQDLLYYAENFEVERGAAFLWVEHGTANPDARGFWDRYFAPFQYEMVRKIEW